MGSLFYDDYHSEQLDDKRWVECLRVIKAAMLAAGWHPRAGKFDEVQRRRARSMYYA